MSLYMWVYVYGSIYVGLCIWGYVYAWVYICYLHLHIYNPCQYLLHIRATTITLPVSPFSTGLQPRTTTAPGLKRPQPALTTALTHNPVPTCHLGGDAMPNYMHPSSCLSCRFGFASQCSTTLSSRLQSHPGQARCPAMFSPYTCKCKCK